MIKITGIDCIRMSDEEGSVKDRRYDETQIDKNV